MDRRSGPYVRFKRVLDVALTLASMPLVLPLNASTKRFLTLMHCAGGCRPTATWGESIGSIREWAAATTCHSSTLEPATAIPSKVLSWN